MEEITFGEKVKNARILRGLTQDELATKCKLGLRTIQRIEGNEVKSRFYTVKIICDELNIEMSQYNILESTIKMLHYNIMKNLKTVTLVVGVLMFSIAVYKIIALNEKQWLGVVGGGYLLWLYFNMDRFKD